MDKELGHTMEQTATAVSYTASGATVFMGLTVDEWGIAAAVIGILGVVCTFIFNAWFKMKYQRD
jgi:uncharacterized membrane protein